MISIHENVQKTEVDENRQTFEKNEQYRIMMLDFKQECIEIVNVEKMYQELNKLSLNFGKIFTNLTNIHVINNKCLTKMFIFDTVAIMSFKFKYSIIVHSVTLDNYIHALFSINARYKKTERETLIFTFIEELFVFHKIATKLDYIFEIYVENESQIVKFRTSDETD